MIDITVELRNHGRRTWFGHCPIGFNHKGHNGYATNFLFRHHLL